MKPASKLEFDAFPDSIRRASRSEFLETIRASEQEFLRNRFIVSLNAKTVSMGLYHNLLKMLFHQVRHSSNSFRLASEGCKVPVARDYLLHHAEEEETHWTWIIDDLRNTGYEGTMPDMEFPREACQAYVAFNYFVANVFPLARLAVAMMLENLGAKIGAKYARLLCQSLNLKESQATFFFGHGDTDVIHTKELLEVIDKCDLSPEQWGWMCYAAEMASKMYRRMYDEVITEI